MIIIQKRFNKLGILLKRELLGRIFQNYLRK